MNRLRMGLGLLVGGILGLLAFIVAGPFILTLVSQFEPPDKSTWGSYRGRLIDSETKQPITGASVAAESRVPLQLFSDRDDTRSNKAGEFVLRVPERRDAWVTIRAKGYAPLGYSSDWPIPTPLELVRATAREQDLRVSRIRIPPTTHLDGFRIDLEKGCVVEGDDYDVAVRLDPADTSKVLAEAGPGRGLSLAERGDCIPWYSMPANLKVVPEVGYVRVARAPRHGGSMLCIVRREHGPRYGVMGFNPHWWFPGEGRFRYTEFEAAFNRAGGRGFLGAKRMIFQ